jgi:hypothetical protein
MTTPTPPLAVGMEIVLEETGFMATKAFINPMSQFAACQRFGSRG